MKPKIVVRQYVGKLIECPDCHKIIKETAECKLKTYYCGKCGKLIVDAAHDYCGWCGEKIDWVEVLEGK
jgi:uncharacterized OB-fold protein